MSKAVLQLLAVTGTLDILSAQFMFDHDYDFHHYQQAVEGRSGSSNGVPEKRWLDSGRCGARYTLPDYKPAQCNPYDKDGCCNLKTGWCGSTKKHCSCKHCIDYRNQTIITSAHSTLPPTGKRIYSEYRGHFADRQCPQIGLFEGKSNTWCKKKCDETAGCTAINLYIHRENTPSNLCSLRACGLDPPYPIADGQQSYSLKPIAKNYTRYNGPQDKYYARSQGCTHLHPTHRHKSYIECQEICDDEAFCIGFNFNLKNFNCAMYYCDEPTIAPEGVEEENWESWAKVKFAEGYNGPESKYYSSGQEGCVHIHPTHENTSYADCEKLCDGEPYCIGFNHNINMLHCELFYCKNPATQPKGDFYKNWESYSKRTFIKSAPRIYIKIEKSRDQSHVNDKTCFIIESYGTAKSLAACEHLCDVEHSQCKGFYFNAYAEKGCILQTCRHKSPFPVVQESGWQGYVVQHERKPKSYIIPTNSHGFSYTNQQCRAISEHGSNLRISYCKTLCDLTAKCTAFNFHSRQGCVLRACGHDQPHPIAQDDGWQGYVLDETKRNGQLWSPLNRACIKTPIYQTVFDSEMSNCQVICELDQEQGVACKSISYEASTKACKFSVEGSTSDNYTQPCEGHFYTEIVDIVPRNYSSYSRKYFFKWQCPQIAKYSGKSISGCKLLCDSASNCNVINYGYELENLSTFFSHPTKLCVLYACGNSPPNPLGNVTQLIRFHGYSVKKDIQEYGAIDVKIIDSSETHEAYLEPEMVLDGSTSTFWNPEPNLSSWYITFKLGYRYKVTSMNLRNYGDGKHDVTQFKLEISYDNVKWYLGLESNVKAKTNKLQTFDGFTDAFGNFLRITVTNTSGYQPWITELGFLGYSPEGIARYDGPHVKYYTANSGCVQLKPTYRNITYVECEEYCDSEQYCTAFNLVLATTRICELWFCDNAETPPGGVDDSDIIKTWRKKDYRARSPHSYIILPESEEFSYSNFQCRNLGEHSFTGIYRCKKQCDLKAKCTAFDFHPKFGCVLRACGQHPPHPIDQRDGWQGYVLEETKRNNGKSWYYGPLDGSFSGICIKVKTLPNSRTLVECEEECDNNPWCSGFDNNANKNPGPICELYVCRELSTRRSPAKGITSWSKYTPRGRGHECDPGQTKSAGDKCNKCFCVGGRWDCTHKDCPEETTKKEKKYIWFEKFRLRFRGVRLPGLPGLLSP